MSRRLIRPVLALLFGLLLLAPMPVKAAPVSWKEVPPTTEGRQWWDEGSLRINRAGNLTVLSRFEAAPEGSGQRPGASSTTLEGTGAGPAEQTAPTSAAPAGALPASPPPAVSAGGRPAPVISRLYVMELDCDQSLYRDVSVNGLPQFGASWQPTGSDDLTAEVLRQACTAGAA